MTTNLKKRIYATLLSTLVAVTATPAATPKQPYRDIASDQFSPAGWVEEFLNRQVTGLTGHPEQSGFPFNKNGWIDGLDYTEREVVGGQDWFPYEQAAYYLDGALRCGYLVHNSALKRRALDNIEYMLNSVNEDGQMRLLDIEDDWWPLVVFIRLMIEEYEVSGDPRILDALVKHYKATYADGKGESFNFEGFAARSLLHVEHLCSLYGYTGDSWFIEIAERLYKIFEEKGKNVSAITAKGMNQDLSPSGHAVTYHEFLKLPATLYYYTGKEYYRTAFEKGILMLERDHELADGLSSAVEFTSGKSSAMAHELCNTIDYNWSVGWALLATGNAYYADKIEKCLYNSGFAAITPDFKAHQYYSAPNMPISSSMSSDYNDATNWGMFGKKRLCYRPGHDTECCSGNVHRMLPTFINRSSMVNNDGVMINFYIPGSTSVECKGERFEFTQQTAYPFDLSTKITIDQSIGSKMTLGLRIPDWATAYRITINQEEYVASGNDKAHYEEISRKFKSGDVIELTLKTEPRFEQTYQGVSVSYGALLYSYPIECIVEKATHDCGAKCSEEFPAYELFPRSPLGWAYAIDTTQPIEIVECEGGAYPWDFDGAPIELKVKARAVTNWKLRDWTYNTEYPEVLETNDTEQTLTLKAMGTTLLRITDFPQYK
ncbi:MAG: glycoside hydrolase family 127 protein [Rikenellaceae bacterium]